MRIRRIRVPEEEESEELVPVLEGWVIPARFVAKVELQGPDCLIRLEIEADEGLRCTSITIRPLPPAEAVQPAALRAVSLEGLMVAAGEWASRPAGTTRPVSPEVGVPMRADALRKYQQAIVVDESTGTIGFIPSLEDRLRIRTVRATRDKRVTDSLLAEVAKVYRNALEKGSAPSKTVAEQLHASDSTARRWVQKARERGFLGQTTPGRKGG